MFLQYLKPDNTIIVQKQAFEKDVDFQEQAWKLVLCEA